MGAEELLELDIPDAVFGEVYVEWNFELAEIDLGLSERSANVVDVPKVAPVRGAILCELEGEYEKVFLQTP